MGGTTFDAALENAASGVRVIICGQIGSLRGGPGIKSLMPTIRTGATIYGLGVNNPLLVAKWSASFEQDLPRLVKEGKIKCREDRRFGLQHAEQAVVDQITGRTIGKPIIVVSEE